MRCFQAVTIAGVTLAVTMMSGCALFRSARSQTANPTRTDSSSVVVHSATVDSTEKKPVRPDRRSQEKPPEQAKAPARHPIEDKASADNVEVTPVLTVRRTPAEEGALREQIIRDIDRAGDAMAAIRGRSLTSQQSENLAMAQDFLRGARASIGTDLARAGTLAEKARVLAEDLKSEVLK